MTLKRARLVRTMVLPVAFALVALLTATCGGGGGGGNGGKNRNAAPTLLRIQVTPPIPTIANGTARQFTATGSYDDGSAADLTTLVTWSSGGAGDTGTAAMDASGLATAIDPGTVTIIAAITPTEGAASLTATAKLTITAAKLASIQVTSATDAIAKGTAQQYTATGIFSDSTTQDITALVNWSAGAPTDTGTAAFSGSGLATATGVGTVTITATDPATNIMGTAELTVTAAEPDFVQVTPALPAIVLGQTQQFTAVLVLTDATTQNINATTTWTAVGTGDGGAADITPTGGMATGTGIGTVTITATDSGTGLSGETTLTISGDLLVGITVMPPAPSAPKGVEVPFTATGTYSNGSTVDITDSVVWSATPGTGTATIITSGGAGNGIATGTGVGTVTITAAFGGINGKSGTATFTVTAAEVRTIAVTPPTASVPKGNTAAFMATATLTDGTTADYTDMVNWMAGLAGDTGSATISTAGPAGTNGIATGTGEGTVSIMFAHMPSRQAGLAMLTVTSAELVNLIVSPQGAEVVQGKTRQYTAQGTYSDTTTADVTDLVSWTAPTVDGGAAAITSSGEAGTNGLATGTVPGNVTITATRGATQGTANLTIAPKLLERILISGNAIIPVGTSAALNATGYHTDNTVYPFTNLQWSSSDPVNFAVDADTGVVSVAATAEPAVSSATISATEVGVVGFGGGEISGTYTVTAGGVVLTSLSIGGNTTIPVGTSDGLTVTGTGSDGAAYALGTVAWSSSDPANFAVDSATGVVSVSPLATVAPAPATATISATSQGVVASVTVIAGPAIQTGLSIDTADPLAVDPGGTVQFSATAHWSDTSTSDVTSTATWNPPTNPDVTVDAAGLATVSGTAQVGGADVTATHGAFTSAPITVSINRVVTGVAVAQGAAWGGFHPVGVPGGYNAWGTYNDGLAATPIAADWTCAGTWAYAACPGAPSGVASASLTFPSADTVTITATDPGSGRWGVFAVQVYALDVVVSTWTSSGYPNETSVGEWMSWNSAVTDVAGAGLSYEWLLNGAFYSNGNGDGSFVDYLPGMAGINQEVILNVTDGFGATGTGSVLFTVHARPMAVPGSYGPIDFTATPSVGLDGGGSLDPINGGLTHAWAIAGAPPASTSASLTGATTATPTLTADVPGDYTVSLTVTDQFGTTDTASTTVTFTGTVAPLAGLPLTGQTVAAGGTGRYRIGGLVASTQYRMALDGLAGGDVGLTVYSDAYTTPVCSANTLGAGGDESCDFTATGGDVWVEVAETGGTLAGNFHLLLTTPVFSDATVVAIPDNDPLGANGGQIAVSGVPVTATIAVVTVTLTHPALNEVDIWLLTGGVGFSIKPGAFGGGGAAAGTTFTMVTSVADPNAPWDLNAVDGSPLDGTGGTLHGWSIAFQ